jgi:hypothetical protein
MYAPGCSACSQKCYMKFNGISSSSLLMWYLCCLRPCVSCSHRVWLLYLTVAFSLIHSSSMSLTKLANVWKCSYFLYRLWAQNLAQFVVHWTGKRSSGPESGLISRTMILSKFSPTAFNLISWDGIILVPSPCLFYWMANTSDLGMRSSACAMKTCRLTSLHNHDTPAHLSMSSSDHTCGR